MDVTPVPGLRGLIRGMAWGNVVGGSVGFVALALHGTALCVLFAIAVAVGCRILWATSSDEQPTRGEGYRPNNPQEARDA